MRKFISVSFILLFFFIACPDDSTPDLDPPTLVAPSNGSTISQNPPTFIWHVSDEDPIVYLLEIATDSLFTSSSIINFVGPITPPDTSYTLSDSLAAGTFYWHACVLEDC